MEVDSSITALEEQLLEHDELLLQNHVTGDTFCTGDIFCGSNFTYCVYSIS